jgi:hypothetical protein
LPKFPFPPPVDRLRAVRDGDDVVAVVPMTSLARVFRAAGENPLQWNEFRTVGPLATARFDPHPPTADGRPAAAPRYGVMYLGLSLRTCLAEAFQGARVVDRHTDRPTLAVFRPARVLRLLDLTGTWPTRAGASQAISTGRRDRARAWARAIFDAYDDIDGLWYRSSMNAGQPAVCLWEQAAGAVTGPPDALLPLDASGLALPIARDCRRLGYRYV